MDLTIAPMELEFCYNNSTLQVTFSQFINPCKNVGTFSKYGVFLCFLINLSLVYFLKIHRNKKSDRTSTPLKIPGPHPLIYHVSALFLPLVILTTLLFLIFKQFVKIYLILKHGGNFGGFFASADTVWWVQKNNSNVVPLLLVIKSKEKIDIVGKIKARLRDKIFFTKDYPKLTSTCQFFCGYPYMILDQYKLEDCVHDFFKNPGSTQKFDENYFLQVVSDIGYKEFQKREALWEIYVTNRHLDIEEKEYRYPICFKINHAVGDGISIVTFILKLLGDSMTEQYIEQVVGKYLENAKKNRVKPDFRTQIVDLKNVIFHTFRVIYIALGRIIWWAYLRERDQNVLHGPPLSGEKIAVVSWEQQQELVPLVKKIKNRIPNCKFSDVLYTALSVSVTNFYKRNGQEVPQRISTILPLLLSYREVAKPGPAKLINRFTVSFLDLPTHQAGSLCETLEKVKYQNLLVTQLPEVEINYWFLNYIVGNIPIPILEKTLNYHGFTQAVSNIPGSAKTTFLGGYDLANVVCFTPQRWKTGFGVVFVTYDQKLQVGLLVDKALISSRGEAQKIVDEILENIRKIDMETSGLSNGK